MTTPQPETAVTLQSAYTAAVERASKTTGALILAEAQILDLTEKLVSLERELTEECDRTAALRARIDRMQRETQTDEPDAAAVD